MKTSDSPEYIQHIVRNRKPSMSYDGSVPLAQWQLAAREKLTNLLGLPLTRCDADYTVTAESKTAEYTRTDFLFQSEPGYYVPCTMLMPRDACGKLPIAICLQGHSTGKHISVGEVKFPGDAKTIAGGRDFALQAVRLGFCAIALEQRYMGACGVRPDGIPGAVCGNSYSVLDSLLVGRVPIGERVWDISRLIDLLEAKFADRLDVNTIVCMGNSGGGTAAFYAACMEERIRLAMPSCAVCSYDASILAMPHCACNFVPGIRNYFDMGDLGCLIAPRRFVLVCGQEDSIFPLPGVRRSFATIQQAYQNAGRPELCRMVIGNAGHQFYPEDAWPVARELLAIND